MAKKCDCHGVVAMMETDPRLRALPLAPRMLWFALVRAMQGLGLAAFRFGLQVPGANEIALSIGITETELEANLPTLLGRGLLDREADGALSSPLLRQALARSETNRINGLKGGRPRKATPGTDPRQVPMVHVVPGGLAGAGAVKDALEKANPAAGVSVAKLAEPVVEKAKVAVGDETYHATGRAVLAAMNLDPARSTAHYGIVRQWLADGADQPLILDVVAAKMARGAKPSQPAYFTAAVAEAVRKRAEAPVPAGQAVTAGFAGWERDYQDWKLAGRVGPMPTLTGTANQVAA